MIPLAWTHAGGAALAAFLAAIVECIEALTVVLAVGATRGWRPALLGSALALLLLVALTAGLGPLLPILPLAGLRLVLGVLLLLFGLRWLRKAVLRAAGVIPLRDEQAAYAREVSRLGDAPGRAGFDWLAFGTALQIVLVEGIEVVFIVIAVGAGPGRLLPAAYGAGLAVCVVVALGLALHRPIARVPENSLKFAVGVLLTGFGLFWTGEAVGADWPGGDWSLPGLVLLTLAVALALVRAAARDARHA